jgi:hypothetical protein
MGVAYCTSADVQTRAQIYKVDIANGAGIGAGVTEAIADASSRVRAIAAVTYRSAVLDGYAPDFPPDVVSLATLLAVRNLYVWVTTADSSRGKPAVVDSIDKDAQLYVNILRAGALVDANGDAVPTLGAFRVASPNPVLDLEITSYYAGGPRG